MATLFNTKISQTYQGLFKTIDNAILTAAFKELTDGSGNQSGLFLNTAGDFKVTAILEWGSLKDTGTGVTITQFVTAANGIGNFNNDTTLPTSAAVKLYVDTKFSQTDTLTEVLGFGNTTSGKDIAVSAGDDITFTDSSKILMGASSDLQIYHDASNSYIDDTGTGDLYLRSNKIRLQSISGENLMFAQENSGVFIYFNNAKKFETTLAGAEVTGNLVVTGTITGAGGSFLPTAGGTMTGNIVLNDNVKSIYGTASDGLEIFHDSNNSFLKDSGTGGLNIIGSRIQLQNSNGEGYIDCTGDQVEIKFNNLKKFETTTSGVAVTGNLVTTANVNVGANATFVDGGKALFGDSNDLTIFHDGASGEITNTTGGLLIKTDTFRVLNAAGSEQMLRADTDDAVQLYFNNVVRLATVTDGAKVTGNLEVTGTISGSGGSFLPLIGGIMTGNTIHNDNVKSIYGTASDGLEIYHDSLNSVIRDQGTGNMVLAADDFRLQVSDQTANMITANTGAEVNLMFNAGTKLATTSTGISVTGNGVFSSNVTIPDAGQLQLGTGNDAQIYHDSSNFYAKNLVGQFNIEQAAATESIVFKTSNNFAVDTTALTISRNGDMLTGRNVTIAGDLTVNGTTTTVNSQTLSVVDPLIQLAKANTANSLDIGFYGDYNDGTGRFLGLFSDASDSNKFKLFKGTTVEPTTTVNIAGAGYVAADLELANLTGNGTILLQGATTQTIRLIDNTQGVTLSTFAQDANAGFGTFSNHSLNIYSNSLVSLTLDASQNATFRSFVTLGDNASSRAGTLRIDSFVANQFWKLEPGTNTLNIKDYSGTSIISINGETNDTTFVGNIILGTADSLYLNGTTGFRMLHDGANALFINQTAGDIKIQNSATDKDIKFIGKDGASVITALNLDMSEGGAATFVGSVGIGSNPTSKLQIEQSIVPRITMIKTGVLSWYVGNPTQGSSTNFTIGTDSGSNLDILTLDTSGNATFAGDISLVDNKQLVLGTSGNFNMFFDGSNTTLQNFTGDLNIVNKADDKDIYFRSDNGSGGTTAYFYLDGSEIVTRFPQDIRFEDNIKANFGASSDLQIYHDGSGNFIKGAPNLYVQTNGAFNVETVSEVDMIKATAGDAVELYFAGTKRIETTSTGVTISSEAVIGNGTNGLQFSHSTGNSSGIINTGFNSTAIEIRTANIQRLLINSTGATFAGSLSAKVGTFQSLDASESTLMNLVANNGNNAATFRTTASGSIFEIRSQNSGTIKIDSSSTTFTGNATFAGTILASNNSPAYSFASDTGTGIARTGTQQMSFVHPSYTSLNLDALGRANFPQKVAIGVSSFGAPLTVQADGGGSAINIIGRNNGVADESIIGFYQNDGTTRMAYILADEQDLDFATGGSNVRMKITSGGNICIGENTTSYKVRVKSDATVDNGIYISAGATSGNHALYIENLAGSAEHFAVRGDGQIRLNASKVGDVLFGCTSLPSASVNGSAFKKDSKNRYTLMQSSNETGLADLQEFFNPNGAVGKIQSSGSATIYNTASDYRLKEDLQDFAGLEMVSKIPVYDFKWKIDGKRSYGVMAHELQKILPDAAAGKKDAINEDGTINPQGVDYSKIVPLLVKSIQELKAEIELLKAK